MIDTFQTRFIFSEPLCSAVLVCHVFVTYNKWL